MNKAEIQKLIRKVREVRPCPKCGTKRAANREEKPLDLAPGILAVWRCPYCGATPHARFTIWLEPVSPEPPWVREGREELARTFVAEGVTPDRGWKIQSEILGTMVLLELIEPRDRESVEISRELERRNAEEEKNWLRRKTEVERRIHELSGTNGEGSASDELSMRPLDS